MSPFQRVNEGTPFSSPPCKSFSPHPATTSCPFPIIWVVAERPRQDRAAEMDEPWKFLTLSYKPPHTGTHHLTKTLDNTFNTREPQSRVEDTSEHLKKLFQDSTGTYNYYITEPLRAGGFCPVHLLAAI